MKGKTGTISYLWTSISNSLNTKGNWEHFFRHIDTNWRQVAGFKICHWLQITSYWNYCIWQILEEGNTFLFWIRNKWIKCFTLHIYFLPNSFSLRILEPFKPAIRKAIGCLAWLQAATGVSALQHWHSWSLPTSFDHQYLVLWPSWHAELFSGFSAE